MNGGSSFEEVQNGLLNASATIRIGDEVDLLGAITEDATLNDARRKIILSQYELPIRASTEKRAYAVRRTPIEIMVRVIAVTERAGNRNNALIVVISQGDEHVNGSRGGRGLPNADKQNQENE